MGKKLKKAMKAKAEELGWSWDEGFDGSVELENWSPAGEDIIVTLVGENIAQEMRDYANSFDEEDHVRELLNAKANGFAGVPDLKTLVGDAEEIQEMLDGLAEAFEGVQSK